MIQSIWSALKADDNIIFLPEPYSQIKSESPYKTRNPDTDSTTDSTCENLHSGTGSLEECNFLLQTQKMLETQITSIAI